MTDEYLSATSDGVAASIAAAEVMDRLAERLKAADGSAGRMKETRAAAEAVAELAAGADDALAVIDSAKNTAGDVAMKAQTKKSIILDALEGATVDVRTQAAEAGLSLDHGYALDEYLEHDLETVRRIEAGTVDPQPQDDAAATPAPKIHDDDGRVPWDAPAEDVHNHIRGLSPYPGAWTMHDDTRLKLYRSRRADGNGAPGTVLEADDRLLVACGEGAVEIVTIQRPGRERLDAADFLNGYPLAPGDRLGTVPSTES